MYVDGKPLQQNGLSIARMLDRFGRLILFSVEERSLGESVV